MGETTTHKIEAASLKINYFLHKFAPLLEVALPQQRNPLARQHRVGAICIGVRAECAPLPALVA
ncbi:hypothetical protein D3Y59_02480 [Hymenobacter oligotrophus]|uniref:Uncharacterized protein n=1 Tax=Hymenobacter oligotrophus TaxID=2319843 RepID=A0A3B7QY56_9BACT|nr:hypothetical protein D3Y59_02480 [Hymenobacter oligotrophus]